MKKIILGIFFSLIFIGTATAESKNITGIAQTKDGDTIVINGTNLRLDGVDVPEKKQSCILNGKDDFYPGSEARAWLESYVVGRNISCSYTNTGAFGRPIATCFVDGKNLNELLIRYGYADIDPRYNLRYSEFLEQAKLEKIGMWRGECEKPWVWRKQEKARNKAEKEQ